MLIDKDGQGEKSAWGIDSKFGEIEVNRGLIQIPKSNLWPQYVWPDVHRE